MEKEEYKTYVCQLADLLEDSLEDADFWYSECPLYAEHSELSIAHQQIKTKATDILRQLDKKIQEELANDAR